MERKVRSIVRPAHRSLYSAGCIICILLPIPSIDQERARRRFSGVSRLALTVMESANVQLPTNERRNDHSALIEGEDYKIRRRHFALLRKYTLQR